MAESPEFMTSLLRMAGALVLVLGMVLGGLYLSRRLKIGGGSGKGGSLLNILASRYVGTRQWILIVEAAGTPLVVGVSRDRIQLLSELDPAALSAWREKVPPSARIADFPEHLRQMIRKEPGEEKKGEGA